MPYYLPIEQNTEYVGGALVKHLRLENVTGAMSDSAPTGRLEYKSDVGDEHLRFGIGGSSVEVPRLDLNELVSGVWNFGPGVGNVPFTVGLGLSGLVSQLNSDLLDGYHGDVNISPDTYARRQSDGTLKASDPVNADELATKGYVDSVNASQDWKDSAVAAASTNVDISSAPSAVDGVTLSTNDRVLLPVQTDASESGLYSFNGVGSAMTRTEDADESSEVTIGMTVFVEGGNTHAGAIYTLTSANADPIVLDTSELTFTQTGGQSVFGAGNGIVKADSKFHFIKSTNYTPGNIVYATSATEMGFLSNGGSGTVLKGGATPSWASIDLTADVGASVLPVSNGGSGTSDQFTQGAVIFAGPSGVYAQDVAGIYFDSITNRLGVNNQTPGYTVDVGGTLSVGGSSRLGTSDSHTVTVNGNITVGPFSSTPSTLGSYGTLNAVGSTGSTTIPMVRFNQEGAVGVIAQFQANSLTYAQFGSDVNYLQSNLVVGGGTLPVGSYMGVFRHQVSACSVLVGSVTGSAASLIIDGASNGDGLGGDYASIIHQSDGVLKFNNAFTDSFIDLVSDGRNVARFSHDGKVSLGRHGGSWVLDVYTSTETEMFRLLNVVDGAQGPIQRFEHDTGSPAAGDTVGTLEFVGRSSDDSVSYLASLRVVAQAINTSSVDGDIRATVYRDGSAYDVLTVTHDQRVGINNTAPTEALDVTGNVLVSGTAEIQTINATGLSTPDLLVNNGGTIERKTPSANIWSTIPTIDGSGAAGTVAFWLDGDTIKASSNLVWDDGQGRMGINQSSPQAALHVNGSIRVDGGIEYHARYKKRVISLASPPASSGPGKWYIRLQPTTASNIVSLKVRVTSSWSYSPAFGWLDADVSYHATGSGISSSHNYLRVTNVSGRAAIALRIGQVEEENGYISLPVWCLNSNTVIVHLEYYENSVTLDSLSVTSWTSDPMPDFVRPTPYGFDATFRSQIELSESTDYAGVAPAIEDSFLTLSNHRTTSAANMQSTLRFQLYDDTYERFGAFSMIAESASNLKTAFVWTPHNGATASEAMRLTSEGKLGVNENSPEGQLHVTDGSAGGYTLANSYNTAVLESDGTTGLTLVSADANAAGIRWNSPGSTTFGYAGIRTQGFTDGSMILYTNQATGKVQIAPGLNAVSVTVSGDGYTGFGEESPARRVHIKGTNNVTSTLRMENTAAPTNNVWDLVAHYNQQDLRVIANDGATLVACFQDEGLVGLGETIDNVLGDNTDSRLSSNAPILHVKSTGTSGSHVCVARFEGGPDADNSGAAIRLGHSNDRGLQVLAGRGTGDQSTVVFSSVTSGGHTRDFLEVIGGAPELKAVSTDQYVTISPEAGRSLYVTNDGVGIGIDTPTMPLEVEADIAGDVNIAGLRNTNAAGGVSLLLDRGATHRASQLKFSTSGVTDYFVGVLRDGGGSTTKFAISAGSDLNVTEPAFCIRDGNVGIGTHDPSLLYKLDVAGDARVTGELTIGTVNTTALGSPSVLVDNGGVVEKKSIDSRAWGTSLVDGSGVANRLAYWTDSDSLNDSGLSYDHTTTALGVGPSTPAYRLDITASTAFVGTGAMRIDCGLNSSGSGLLITANTRTASDVDVPLLRVESRNAENALIVDVEGKVTFGRMAANKVLGVDANSRLTTSITTSNLAEGSNLYYTDARVLAYLGTRSTSDLAEGSNLYYTDARVLSVIGTLTTDDIAEGSNLYYTDARARGALSSAGSNEIDYNQSTGVIGLGTEAARMKAFTIGDNSSTSITVTHNFGTRDVYACLVNRTTPYAHALVYWEAITENTVTFKFSKAPTTNQFRAMVIAPNG